MTTKRRAKTESTPAISQRCASPSATIDALGLDAICGKLRAGESLTSIAAFVRVGKTTLIDWIAVEPDRSARTREARSVAALMYDELADHLIEQAADPFELAKAKERAHHLRWRASKVNPAAYGDKLDLTQKVTIADLPDDELLAKAARLTALMAGKAD